MTGLQGDDLPDTAVPFPFIIRETRSEAQVLPSAGLRAVISVSLRKKEDQIVWQLCQVILWCGSTAEYPQLH